ncbi:MAG: hypothetical protein AAGI71_08740 [Bacteroidota bacterium]
MITVDSELQVVVRVVALAVQAGGVHAIPATEERHQPDRNDV